MFVMAYPKYKGNWVIGTYTGHYQKCLPRLDGPLLLGKDYLFTANWEDMNQPLSITPYSFTHLTKQF